MTMRKVHYKSLNTRLLIGKMITFKFVRFTFVVYVSHTVNLFVTDIILHISSLEHLTFTLLHIGSILFDLFSKEERVMKQPGMPSSLIPYGFLLTRFTECYMILNRTRIVIFDCSVFLAPGLAAYK